MLLEFFLKVEIRKWLPTAGLALLVACSPSVDPQTSPTGTTVPVAYAVVVGEQVTRSLFVEANRAENHDSVPLSVAGVITRMPISHGDQLSGDGSVVVEVNGTPVFALAGDFPFWEDIQPGHEGRDVEQLQEALLTAGLDPGEADGRYGPQTQAAIAAMYTSAGYDPPDAVGVDEYKTATAALAEAQAALADLTATQEETPRTVVVAAQNAVDAAADAVREASARMGTPLPMNAILFIPDGDWQLQAPNVMVGSVLAGPELTRVSTTATESVLIIEGDQDLLAKLAASVTVGQTVTGNADGLIPWQGSIIGVSGGGDPGAMHLTVTGPPDDFEATTVQIILESSAASALAVPAEALHTGSSGEYVIRLSEGGDAENVPVDVLVVGDLLVAVDSEILAVGDKVLLP